MWRSSFRSIARPYDSLRYHEAAKVYAVLASLRLLASLPSRTVRFGDGSKMGCRSGSASIDQCCHIGSIVV